MEGIIASADYIIDLGPKSGDEGGTICGCGSPKEIAKLNTYTGKALRDYLNDLAAK